MNMVEESAPIKLNQVISDYQLRWENRSSVRTRPRKPIDFSREGTFFPEDKQPLLLNDFVRTMGSDIINFILVETFYKYLHDITHLEVEMINSACHKIIYGNLPVQFSEVIKLEAHTILIDEYYHVYNARDMMMQLDRQFPGRTSFHYPQSDSAKAIETIKSELPTVMHDIFEIIAVCIFETTLVRELVEFFNTPNVHPSIKNYVNDHMNDESRHYKYFFDLLNFIWCHLPVEYRELIGLQFGKFIKLYLNIESDKLFNKMLLNFIIKNETQSAEIIEKIYKGFDITPEVPIVKNVISVFKNTKMMDDEFVISGFRSIGWIF